MASTVVLTALRQERLQYLTSVAVRARAWLLLVALVMSGVAPAQVGLPETGLDHAYVVPLVALALIAVAERVVLGRVARPLRAFDWIIVGWIVLAAASAMYSEAPGLTIRRVVPLIVLYMAVMWSGWSHAENAGDESVVDQLLLGAAVVCVASWILLLFRPDEMLTEGRLRGIVGVPNWLALLIALVLPLAVWRALVRRRASDRLVLAVVIIGLLMTGTRGAVIAAAIGTSYVLWQAHSRLRWVPVIVLSGYGLLLLNAASLNGTWLDVNYFRLASVATGSGRFQPWLTMVNIIGQRPLLGYGFGTEELILNRNAVLPYELSGLHIHDSFLGLAQQTGLIGMTAFFVPLFILAGRELRFNGIDAGPSLRVALIGSMLVGLVECISESWIYSTGNPGTLPFWLVLMLLLRRRLAPAPRLARARPSTAST